ncbi:hypothetical protein LEP1GSC021_1049 [Leptospira noguchii str. 1993005606]|uniref:Uncharacterized protein n=1 Tax=Leptospira noguchii str. 2007001578 TaxID=1049974 RepID=A0ABN0J3A4_9LEPT|nr:hypothetical protein LEP1GSC035_4478 [Leptospira noguchii str. 2007001578]EPE84438.1 hypothetical protein LEP1GSC021_1049 [Leptospira noguchii str. 1993005606]
MRKKKIAPVSTMQVPKNGFHLDSETSINPSLILKGFLERFFFFGLSK